MNDANPEDQISESERENRVIKDKFRIAYYQLSYKKTPRVMIRHLAMTVTRNLIFCPTKVAESDHYGPHIIL